MEKEFVQYTEALALKELGFDEPCFGYYKYEELIIEGKYKNSDHGFSISTPSPQQAFRFFRENHDLIGEIFSQLRPSNKFMYGFKIGGSDIIFDGFYTYEEAELECLKRLIEIVKEK